MKTASLKLGGFFVDDEFRKKPTQSRQDQPPQAPTLSSFRELDSIGCSKSRKKVRRDIGERIQVMIDTVALSRSSHLTRLAVEPKIFRLSIMSNDGHVIFNPSSKALKVHLSIFINGKSFTSRFRRCLRQNTKRVTKRR